MTDTGLIDPDGDPLALFGLWLGHAREREPNDPNAMALASVGADGMPSVRMVLLKDWGEDGFAFYTNTQSRKARELAENRKAALLFYWKSLRRQIRIEGMVAAVEADEADAYFATRPRQSQLGAWASAQSQPLESRWALETAVAKYAARYPVGRIPRPPFWSGYRLTPLALEFWQDRPFRLHDRVRFTRSDGGWSGHRLYP